MIRGLMIAVVSTILFSNCPAAAEPPTSFAHLVSKAGPAVVNIIVVQQSREPAEQAAPDDSEGLFPDFFERFLRERLPREYLQGALGSGFVIDPDGLILTSNHVVENAAELKVRLSNDREFQGTIVGRDKKTDLALIRIKPDQALVPLDLGDSEDLQVGDWVIAIGNPFGLGHTVTSGIVSAKYRQIGNGVYNNFIQTDAAVNPGNSGGPLLNMQGRVVGINSAIFSQSGTNVGIGFAIPINVARDLLPQLRQGRVRRAHLGVIVQDITPELKQAFMLKADGGALVSDITPGGPSAKAGMQRGDVILSVDGKAIRNSRQLPYLVSGLPIGKRAVLEIVRNGDTLKLPVTTEEARDEPAGATAGSDVAPLPGLSLQTLTPEIARAFELGRTKGVLVTQVDENAAGMDTGLTPGDIIIEANRKSVNDIKALNRILEKSAGNKPILLLVDRDGRSLFMTINLRTR